MFRPDAATKQFSSATKPFFAFCADIRKPRVVIDLTTKTADSADRPTGERHMRILSVILAVAFLVVPSMAGAPDGSLPGVGTFEYNGGPGVHSVAQVTLVAVR